MFATFVSRIWCDAVTIRSVSCFALAESLSLIATLPFELARIATRPLTYIAPLVKSTIRKITPGTMPGSTQRRSMTSTPPSMVPPLLPRRSGNRMKPKPTEEAPNASSVENAIARVQIYMSPAYFQERGPRRVDRFCLVEAELRGIRRHEKQVAIDPVDERRDGPLCPARERLGDACMELLDLRAIA